jgi:tRNA threonylcarbamoyl adenosine modification protein (Sua5/YciO/YrdC/YwlC family)
MARVWDIEADAEAAINAAVAAVNDGDCIVLPTDTVYGIGADAASAHAVRGLLEAKERGRDMPPPVLVAEVSMLRALSNDVTDDVLALAEAFWPGALTLVLNAHPHLRMDLGDRGDTIAVRVPDHDFTRELLRATGPLAVSSANVSGQPAATTVAEAKAQLGKRVRVYLDGGPAGAGEPSTIVDLTSGTPVILRQGRISRAELAAVLPALAEPEQPESSTLDAADEPAAAKPETELSETELPDVIDGPPEDGEKGTPDA